jgi:hypothetical protein
MTHGDAEWTAATVKQYIDALRAADQLAVDILAKDIKAKLDRIDANFLQLKVSVDEFHATYRGTQAQGGRDWLRLVTIITLLISVGIMSLDILGVVIHH